MCGTGGCRRTGSIRTATCPPIPHCASLRDRKVYPHINRKAYAKTLYPPAAQWTFYVLTRFRETIRSVRVAMLLFEALTVWFLVLLLRDFGLPPQRVLLYAWQPLCLWEFAGGGHVDAIMLAFVALALLMHRRNRPFATGVALGLAVLAKLFPIVLVPALWRRWRWNWRMPFAVAATIFLGYLPYALSYSWAGALGFLPGYAAEEGIQNGDRFYFLNMLPSGFLLAHGIPPYRVFAALVLALFAAVAVWAYWKPPVDERSDVQRCALVAALVLGTLSPSMDWYFAWLAVFLPLLGDVWLAWMPTVSFVLYYNWGFLHADEVFMQNSAIFFARAAALGDPGGVAAVPGAGATAWRGGNRVSGASQRVIGVTPGGCSRGCTNRRACPTTSPEVSASKMLVWAGNPPARSSLAVQVLHVLPIQ